jgi:hypothetical protein
MSTGEQPRQLNKHLVKDLHRTLAPYRAVVDHRSTHPYPVGRRLCVRRGRKYIELTKHGCGIQVDGFLADKPIRT